MNKYYYEFGNTFKVKFRKHYCYMCGTELSVSTNHKIVSKKSDEAKYYSFSYSDNYIVGSCDFVHKVFFCYKCCQNIEFVTQLNQEDIDIIIKKVENHFIRKGIQLKINKYFETFENELKEKCNLEFVKNLYLKIEEENRNSLIYRVPIQRVESWERPDKFKLHKIDLINFIQSQYKVEN